jgi:glucose 1-dehydrogenase
MKLQGKNALVTGSDQGIGQAIALKLAEEGADVVVNYRKNREGGEDTAGRIRQMGRKSAAIQADVGHIAEGRKLVEDAVAAVGPLDILVNNAGIEKRASFLDVTEEDYRSVVEVNMTAPFFLAQTFVRKLVEARRPGKVINISSVHEELPFPHFTPYCMAKGGLKMMMRNLAVELGSCGVTVNNIAPGAIETPINRQMLSDPELVKTVTKNIPLGRIGKPEDVAALAAFLASSDADYVTGSTFYVDGGLLWNYSEQ